MSSTTLNIEIAERDSWEWTMQMREAHWCGLVGNFIAENGSYHDLFNNPLEVEMHTEKIGSGLWVIAVTSPLFIGHERGVGGRGESRRTVHMNKDKSRGSADLDSYRILRLKVLTGN